MPSHTDDTLRTYDAIHELYDAETRDFWDRFPMETVTKFAELLPGRKVLDIGSGPGRDAVILRNLGLEITCLDGSEKMVGMTSSQGFNSIHCDIRDMEFPENSFHGTWAYSSLIHLEFGEARIAIRKLYRIMKPNGLLFLGLIEGSGNEVRNTGGSDFVRYFEYYDDEKVGLLLEGTTFTMECRGEFRPGNHTYLNYIIRKL